MLRLFYLFIFCFLSLVFNAQTDYLVYLKPKNIGQTQIDISNESFKRKLKHNIPIDIRDYAIESSRIQRLSDITPINIASRWLNAVSITCSKEDIARIQQLDFVDRIEVINTRVSRLKTTSNKLESNYTKEQYGASFTQIELHNGHTLHNDGYEGQGIKIAVFDAGFDNVDRISSFKHLFAENRIFPVRNIVENSNDLFRLDGHGTGVLGCMAAYYKDSIVASAPKANYYLFITEDPRSETRIEEFNWAKAAEMADSIGIDIINSSLGYHHFDDPSQNYTRDDMNGNTTIVSKAAAIAVEKGIIVVNSAGNHGNKDWNIITAPADVEGVVSVGALDIHSNLADFSSRGHFKSFAIKPNIVGVGKGTTLYYDAGSYHYGSGTSFSSPLLAGLIACFWQKNSSLNPTELRSALYTLGTNYLTPNRDIGFGIPKFDKGLDLNQVKMKERVLSVYPNPSNGHTILEISSSDILNNTELEVYFGSKAIMKTKVNLYKGVNHIFINTEDYAKGLYFFKVKMGNYSLEERYIKN
jgi:subtilisin family serine protease